MARVARIVVPDHPHHVTQRGNRRDRVFDTAADALTYLRLLRHHTGQLGVDVWAYCLMPNHVHLVAVPHEEAALSLALRNVHSRYAMYFNQKRRLDGHLWQGRFFSCPLDEQHLWTAVRYVERNPVRAGFVELAEAYRWSSAAAHCGLRQDTLLSSQFPPPGVIPDWSQWLREADVEDERMLRKDTKTGTPCGGNEFMEQIRKRGESGADPL